MQFSKEIIDGNIATGVYEFNKFEIENIENEFDQSRYWIENHFLNNIIHAFKPPTKQLVANAIYRIKIAFELYHKARLSTIEFIDFSPEGSPSVGRYFTALSLWEATFLNAHMALSFVQRIVDVCSEKNDYDQKIIRISNRIKHGAGVISPSAKKGTMIPFWLTNDGFHTTSDRMAYNELTHGIRDLALVANHLENPKNYIRSDDELSA